MPLLLLQLNCPTLGDKVLSGVLGGCCLINLFMFSKLHRHILFPRRKAPSRKSFEKEIRRGQNYLGKDGPWFYQNHYIWPRWHLQLMIKEWEESTEGITSRD